MALPPNQTLDKWKQAHNASGGPIASTKQRRLQALLDEVDPSGSFRLDGEAEEIVLYLIEQFMTSVATHSAQLARHRGASAIEHSDVAFTLLKQWNMAVPAIGPSASRGEAGEEEAGEEEGRRGRRESRGERERESMYKGDAEEKDSRAFSSWKEGGMKCPGFVCVSFVCQRNHCLQLFVVFSASLVYLFICILYFR